MSSSAYPFFTHVATPTGRSPQMQARIEDLASKIFTPYQLQKLRTFIPDIKFTAEEAKLYEYNIIDTDVDFKKKLREFVACAYVYDILANTMRDINERVANATREGVLDTSRKELGKIVNSLRGFVALAKDNMDYNFMKDGAWEKHGSTTPLEGDDRNYAVYMNRIPLNVLEKIKRRLDPVPEKFSTKEETQKNKMISVLAPGLQAHGQPRYIQVFKLDTDFLPQYNKKLGGSEASDDCQVSRLIPLLSRSIITVGNFAKKHVERFVDLGVVGWADPATKTALPDLNSGFTNLLAPFIKRDLLAFNRMRSAILNQIDSWWRNHGALAMVDGGVADAPWKSMARMMNADYRVSGLPQPSCPPGYGSLFFNKDPSNPDAKIVDPYIVAADGSLVENPNARYGPYCQRNKNGSDILSGVTNAMSSAGASNLPNFHVANAYRKKRRSHTAKSKRKSRTTRTCGRNAFVGLL
eukprot:jgi/Mesvir1/13331/Mv20263-RA.1